MNFNESYKILNKSPCFSKIDKQRYLKKRDRNILKNFDCFEQVRGNERKKISKKRGKYKICDENQKLEAIRIAQLTSPQEAAEILNIPIKNIRRWLKNGYQRKKGAGRRTQDPEMEKLLIQWMADYFKLYQKIPVNKELKIKARKLSKIPTFKASKGWCDKFWKRNREFIKKITK